MLQYLIIKNCYRMVLSYFSDKPTKPQGPLVPREITSTTAKLEWKPPLDDGGSEITQYEVEYCKVSTNKWTKVH